MYLLLCDYMKAIAFVLPHQKPLADLLKLASQGKDHSMFQSTSSSDMHGSDTQEHTKTALTGLLRSHGKLGKALKNATLSSAAH
jgi:hypothetical protein